MSLYNYEFWLSLCKIVRSSVILLLPLLWSVNYHCQDLYWTWLYIWIIRGCLLRNCFPLTNPWMPPPPSHPPVFSFCFVFCFPIIYLPFLVSGYDVRYDFCIKTMFDSSLPIVVCWIVHSLFTLFVFVCVWWCVFVCVFILCTQCCQLLWIVHSLIAPLVFSNVYLSIPLCGMFRLCSFVYLT